MGTCKLGRKTATPLDVQALGLLVVTETVAITAITAPAWYPIVLATSWGLPMKKLEEA